LPEVEPCPSGDTLHADIVRQNHRSDSIELFIAAHLHEHIKQLVTYAMALPAIADDESELGFIAKVKFAQPAHGNDLGLTCWAILMFDNQSHLTIIIDKADAKEPFMGGALLQTHLREVPVIHGLFAQGLMEFLHQWLIFRPNRANRDGCAIFELQVRNILRGVWANGGARQLVVLYILGVQNYACVQRYQAVRRREQWIDVDFRDASLFNDKLAKSDEQLFQS
jgi:hypothetical protein